MDLKLAHRLLYNKLVKSQLPRFDRRSFPETVNSQTPTSKSFIILTPKVSKKPPSNLHTYFSARKCIIYVKFIKSRVWMWNVWNVNIYVTKTWIPTMHYFHLHWRSIRSKIPKFRFYTVPAKWKTYCTYLHSNATMYTR